jgi:hypothetical protein
MKNKSKTKDIKQFIMVRDGYKIADLLNDIVDKIKFSDLTTLEILGALEYVKLNVFYNFNSSMDKVLNKAIKKLKSEKFKAV